MRTKDLIWRYGGQILIHVIGYPLFRKLFSIAALFCFLFFTYSFCTQTWLKQFLELFQYQW